MFERDPKGPQQGKRNRCLVHVDPCCDEFFFRAGEGLTKEEAQRAEHLAR